LSEVRERSGCGSRRPRTLRDVTRTLHRWLGLVAGVVLLVSGVTGSTLVFRSEIDAALNPHLLRVSPGETRAPLQAMLDSVLRQYPSDPLPARVHMPATADGTLEFWMGPAPDRYVYTDPYSGALLGARKPTEFLTGWLFLLHSHMLSGEFGNKVAGTAALALVLLSLSGIIVWRPRRAPWKMPAQWRAALVVERGGTKRFPFQVHRALGFYASVLLLIAGTTGASLVFPQQFERGAHALMGTRPAIAAAPPAIDSPALATRALPLDTLLAIAERAQPGGAITYLYLPTKPGETFRVRKRLPGEEHPTGKSFVHVDPATGHVLGVEDGTRAPRGARLYSILYPLHIGVLGGTATRLLAVLVGLSVPTLAITGALVWWRRRERRRCHGETRVRRTVRARAWEDPAIRGRGESHG
jgi:uncharacterized iron-regulated membrane protein